MQNQSEIASLIYQIAESNDLTQRRALAEKLATLLAIDEQTKAEARQWQRETREVRADISRRLNGLRLAHPHQP
jgi:(p)ppGpp synthase/HD superfamily hydrolase